MEKNFKNLSIYMFFRHLWFIELLLICIVIILSLNSVSAQYSINNPSNTLLPPNSQALLINNSLNVNASNCWQSYCNPNTYLPYAYNHTDRLLTNPLNNNNWYTSQLFYGDILFDAGYKRNRGSPFYFEDNTYPAWTVAPGVSELGLIQNGYPGGGSYLYLPNMQSYTDTLISRNASQILVGKNNFTNSNNFIANQSFNNITTDNIQTNIINIGGGTLSRILGSLGLFDTSGVFMGTSFVQYVFCVASSGICQYNTNTLHQFSTAPVVIEQNISVIGQTNVTSINIQTNLSVSKMYGLNNNISISKNSSSLCYLNFTMGVLVSTTC